MFEQGYPVKTASIHLSHIRKFQQWLVQKKIPWNDATRAHLRRYIQYRYRRRRLHPPAFKKSCSFGQQRLFPKLLSLLEHAVPPLKCQLARPEVDPFDVYIQYLLEVAGHAPRVIKAYTAVARDFVAFAGRAASASVEGLAPKTIADYVTQACQAKKSGSTLIAGLRSFLRFRLVSGDNAEKLLNAVPSLHRPMRSLPERRLTPAERRQWLAGFARKTPEQKRDWAMVLCLAELGLRPIDTARLQLDDLDWRGRRIRVPNGKTGRPFWLPLPRRLGAALADYLCHGRPHSHRREVFLRTWAPNQEPVTSPFVSRRVKGVALAQGLPPRKAIAYAFRHTLASHMRSGGVTLKNIADVMGHASLDSTAGYAKANLRELAAVAHPWPEALSCGTHR